MVQRATPGCVGGKRLKYPSPGDKQNLPPSADWAGSAHSCGAQRQQLWLALGGGGVFLAQRKPLVTSPAELSPLCTTVTSSLAWDTLPVPNCATNLVLSQALFSPGDLMQACKYEKHKTDLMVSGSQLSPRIQNKQEVIFSHL